MMKFNLGALGDMLFETDPTAKPATTEQSEQPAAAPPVRPTTVYAPHPVASGAVAPTAGPTAAIDPNALTNFIDMLHGKMEKSPASAIIQQFITLLDSLSDAIPDEGSRFRTAIKTLFKTTKVTQEQLTQAFNDLLAVVTAEQGKFSKVVEAQTANEIGTRESSIKSFNEQIESKQKEIEALAAQRDQMAVEMVSERQKIGSMQISFDGAVATVSGEVNDSLNKIRIYASPLAAPATSK